MARHSRIHTRKHGSRKHGSRKHGSRRHGSRRHRSRKMRGGSYTDAASYGMYVNGTTGSQWARTMDQTGPYGQVPGNTIIGAQGQNVTPTSQMPTSNNLKLIQSAGRKHKRGGFIGEVVNQAIVPFALLGAQQSYGRKRKGGKKTRTTRRH